MSQVAILAEASSHDKVLVVLMLAEVAQPGLCRHFTHRHVLGEVGGCASHLRLDQGCDLFHDGVEDGSNFVTEFIVSMMLKALHESWSLTG